MKFKTPFIDIGECNIYRDDFDKIVKWIKRHPIVAVSVTMVIAVGVYYNFMLNKATPSSPNISTI